MDERSTPSHGPVHVARKSGTGSNTLRSPSPQLVIEAQLVALQDAGAAADVEVAADGRNHMIRQQSQGCTTTVLFRGVPESVATLQGKDLEFASYRRNIIMERQPSQKWSKNMGGGAVSYEQAFAAAEQMHFLVHVRKSADYCTLRQQTSAVTDARPEWNVITIEWLPGPSLKRFLVDGEELSVVPE